MINRFVTPFMRARRSGDGGTLSDGSVRGRTQCHTTANSRGGRGRDVSRRPERRDGPWPTPNEVFSEIGTLLLGTSLFVVLVQAGLWTAGI